MVRFFAVVAALLAAIPYASGSLDTCQPLPYPTGCEEPRYRPFLLLEEYEPAKWYCKWRYPAKGSDVTKTVVATKHVTVTDATVTVIKATRTATGPTNTRTVATVTVTGTTVTDIVATDVAATVTGSTDTIIGTTVTDTVSTATIVGATATTTVDTTTVATTVVTITESESDGILITLTVPPVIPTIAPRVAERRGDAPCRSGDYLCSIYSDLTVATETFASYMCSCLQTGEPGKTITVTKTDTSRCTVTATVDKTVTTTRGATRRVTATAIVTATDDETTTVSSTVTATETDTATAFATASATVTTTVDVTASATETFVVTVVSGCQTVSPTPSGDTCGTNYIYIGESDEKVISEGTSATLEECAVDCEETSGCLSLAFSTPNGGGTVGICNLYSASVAQLLSGELIAVPTVNGQEAQAFYDIACFDCGTTPPPGKRDALPNAPTCADTTITMTETVERTVVETVVDMRVQTLWKWRGA